MQIRGSFSNYGYFYDCFCSGFLQICQTINAKIEIYKNTT